MGLDRISIKSMKEIPVVMGEKDIIKVAQMLPDAVRLGDVRATGEQRARGAGEHVAIETRRGARSQRRGAPREENQQDAETGKDRHRDVVLEILRHRAPRMTGGG